MELSHEKSRALWSQSSRVMPLGVSSNFRYWGSETLFAERAKGPYIWDVDGHRFIDYRLGFGPIILGHADDEVDNQVKEALGRGVVYGLTHSLKLPVPDLFVAISPVLEMVRLTNPGTGAVMHARPVARASPAGDKITNFKGQYNGMCDYVLFSTYTDPKAYGNRRSPIPIPSTSGIPRPLHDLIITLPFNDFEVFEATVGRVWHEVAAVLVEPMLGNCASIEPLPGWLELLRQKCTEYGIVLIFDEVKTGFRIARGGAQEVYGVLPDLATYAKAIGNGYPIAAFGGRREIMEVVGVGVVCGGTYAGNAISVAAADATLRLLQNQPILETIAERGRRLQAGLQRIFDEAGIPMTLCGHPAMFAPVIGFSEKPTDQRSWSQSDFGFYLRVVQEAFKRGVLIDRDPREPWFMSYSHTDAVVDETLNVMEDAVRAVRR